MSGASKRGRRNRAKGGAYEAEVARVLTACGIPATKEGHKQRRKKDREGDVHADPFVIECKARQRLNAFDALDKLREEHDGIPVLFWKRPQRIEGGKVTAKKREIVVMDRDEWLAMAVIFRRVMSDAAHVDTTPAEDEYELQPAARQLPNGDYSWPACRRCAGGVVPCADCQSRIPEGADLYEEDP